MIDQVTSNRPASARQAPAPRTPRHLVGAARRVAARRLPKGPGPDQGKSKGVPCVAGEPAIRNWDGLGVVEVGVLGTRELVQLALDEGSFGGSGV